MPGAHSYKSNRPIFENRPELLIESPYTLLFEQNLAVTLPTNRPFEQILAFNLPPGVTFDPNTALLSGVPSALGTYNSRFEASNSAGSLEQDIVFEVKDYRPWIYGVNVGFPGYTENEIIEDFPVYLEIDTSISGFSYEQFSSPFGHDLRFLTSDGVRELPYETISWNPNGTSSFWVLLDKLDENTSIRAIWGNPNYKGAAILLQGRDCLAKI